MKILQRQSGGLFGMMGRMLGLGPRELQQQMSDRVKQQMLMQRGGFPWALAGLSMLPMLMGKGQEDVIRNQMRTTREPAMQRGGFSFSKLFSKALPTIKEIGIPLAVDTLSSMRDKAISKAIGEGRFRNNRPKRRRLRRPPRK